MADASGFMRGKRGLIMGVANNRSIAWGIARSCRNHGADLAFTYQGDALKKRVEPLAEEVDGIVVGHCDVSEPATIDAAFQAVESAWGSLDFVVHAIAFSDKDQLDGRYVDTTADNFTKTMLISCYSFTAIAQRAEKLMRNGGSMLTLTYYGAEKWMPHYNVMGLAKAALECSVRYLAADLGSEEYPRQRDLRRADQDACGVRHRRLPLHPEMERIQHAAPSQCDARRCRRCRDLFPVRPVARRDRRNPSRRCRLPHRRHQASGCAGSEGRRGLKSRRRISEKENGRTKVRPFLSGQSVEAIRRRSDTRSGRPSSSSSWRTSSWQQPRGR